MTSGASKTLFQILMPAFNLAPLKHAGRISGRHGGARVVVPSSLIIQANQLAWTPALPRAQLGDLSRGAILKHIHDLEPNGIGAGRR